MVELIINNQPIELPSNTKIKFTKQIADFFDLAQVSVSFTNSFEFEKSPQNSQAMQQLGISGDSSNIPYIKNDAILKVNGFDLISKGWFNVSGTDGNYKGSILDGMVDFFKAIENRTMGKDLDLSNFNHEKLLSTVVASFTNDYYKYLIADYGGKNLFEGGIDIDYLAPCFSVRKLWELIFSTFGFNCDFTNLSYIDGLYMTYPKDASEGQTDELIADLHKNPYTNTTILSVAGVSQPSQHYTWDTSVIDEGSLISNWKYVIPETTSYNFDFEIEMYVTYRRPNYYNPNVDISFSILKNGVRLDGFNSNYLESDNVGELKTLNFNQTCNAGDVIELIIFAPQMTQFRGRNYRCYEWHHNRTDFKISKTDLGTTILQNELKDFLIKDFIKEIVWRTGLTPVLNRETNTVEFITLDSRIDFSNAQDFSHAFIERTGEAYTNDYAQKNIFKLKNNVDTDNQGDGYLYVYNRNIEDEKTIAQSKIYAPDKKIVTEFIEGIKTNQYKIWEAETKIADDGEISVNYKGLSGRFYFVRFETKEGTFKLISEKLEDETVVSSVPVAINTNTLFEEAIYTNYVEYQKIFTNFRVHNISMALTENEFIGADLTRPFYFKQENAFYIANKVPFTEGEKSIGEFVKINKLVEVLPTINIYAKAPDGYHINFEFPIVSGFDEIITIDSIVKVNGFDFTPSSITVVSGLVRFVVSVDVPHWQAEPIINEIHLKVSNGVGFRYYDYLTPPITFSYSDQYGNITKTLTTNVTV